MKKNVFKSLLAIVHLHSSINVSISKLMVALIISIFSTSLYADDVIVMRNGDIINGTVIEVSSNEIKYKKSSNPSGPLYSIDKNSVLSIKYSNGEIDKFEKSSSTDQNSPKNNLIDGVLMQAKPAEDNENYKAQYAQLPRLNLKPSNKRAKDFFPIMAFTEASVISTKELKIIINPNAVEYYDGGWKVKMGYTIQIVNKTNTPVYIDRANSFRRFNNLTTRSYFDNTTTTVSRGNSSSMGVGVGLGNVGIGYGNSSGSTYSETYGLERFLIVGPQSKTNLIDYNYIRLSENKAKFKTVSDIEYWGFNLTSDNQIKQGEVKTYSESDSPYSNKYYITYSTDSEFKNCYTLEFELYAKYLVGEKIEGCKWAMMSATTRMVNEIQRIVPDFWSNSLVIVGMPGKYH